MKISVILPVYNGASFVKLALESVLRQTLRPAEIIVIDDGSTDGSLSILESYGSDISLHTQANAGVASARNKGVELGSGDLIAFLDQDDIWYPHKLEKQAGCLSSRESIRFVYSNMDLIDGKGRIARHLTMESITPQWISPLLGGRLHPYPSTVLMEKSLFTGAGGFDASFVENMHEDVELWVRIRENTDFFFIPESLVQYRFDRKHSKQKKRRVEVEAANFSHLWNKLHQRFSSDPSKAEALNALAARLHEKKGKALAVEGNFREARVHFKKACRLDPRNRRNRQRLLRTYLPVRLNRWVFPR